MRIYYFDIKDGVPLRDTHGLQFANLAEAIKHSKDLAQRIRNDRRAGAADNYVAVVDESGAELHREPIYPRSA
jgi:hypothetical protein